MYLLALLLFSSSLLAMELIDFENALQDGNVTGANQCYDQNPQTIGNFVKNVRDNHFKWMIDKIESGTVIDLTNIGLCTGGAIAAIWDINMFYNYRHDDDDSQHPYYVAVTTLALFGLQKYVKYRSNKMRHNLIENLQSMQK